MCYNCGCGRLDDDMGDPKNITNKTFEEAAKASGQKAEEAKRNAYDALKKQFEKNNSIYPPFVFPFNPTNQTPHGDSLLNSLRLGMIIENSKSSACPPPVSDYLGVRGGGIRIVRLGGS